MNTIESAKICVECQGRMSPVVIIDKTAPAATKLPALTDPKFAHRHAGPLEYRLPEDRLSFWTGKYPTAGLVQAFMCDGCGRIALYADKPEA
jgi:hypothetical protein